MPPNMPQSGEPLQQRLIRLAQTLQFVPTALCISDALTLITKVTRFAWFVGHVTLLFCTFRYSLSYLTFNYYSRWAKFSYRTAFVAAALTYGIVVFQGYRARQKAGKGPGSPLALAGDENVQYLAMALVWLFSRQTALALLPFAVYSIFHVATYTRGILLPTIQPPPPTPAGQKPQSSGLSDAIGRFVKEYYDSSMSLVAGLEIALWFRLLGPALLFQKGSWILFLVYTIFLRARISQSTFVQGMLRHLGARGDAVANRQDVPPAARQAWGTIKDLAKKAHDATDVGPALYGQSQGAPKKAQ